MQIDLSNTTKFGNLVNGDGLNAVFDGNAGTVGYAQSTSGHAGVSFEQARRIDRVECVSAYNGFDASGLTTGITLQLYGKTGDAPTSATDGVFLGSASFTDQNVVRTITLTSSDKSTPFNHVWVVLVTGVWSLLAELRMFEAPEPLPEEQPEPLGAGSHMFLKSCNDSIALSHGGAEIPQFRIRFALSENRLVQTDFHGCAVHVGAGSDAGVAVGYSFRLCYRSSNTLAGLSSAAWTECGNGVNGGNVINRNPHHYGNASVVDGLALSAGFHEVSVVGSGHTDGSSTSGLLRMLVEGGKGMNRLRVTVLP